MSNAPSPLDQDLKDYFQARIVDSLRLAAYPVVADLTRSSPTPALIHDRFINKAQDFVGMSQALAQHLFDAQQKVRSSPGLLIVSAGTLDSGPCLAILKLQKQEGVNVERTGPKGKETYSVEHLRRLTLTNNTRVFKVALFESDGVVEEADVHALVSDKQRFSSPEKRMADFFLADFLGCRLRDDPAQVTSDYFVRGEKFINERIASPEKRALYHRAWVTDLASQAQTIVPRTFAETHLDEEDRNAFLQFLRDGDVSTTQFRKDTELIASRLQEREYLWASGIRVRGSQEALDAHSEVEVDGELLQMIISDRLQSVKAAPRRR
jgi:37-kD nucleoid-associated bacterial protein